MMKCVQDFYDKYGTGKNYEDLFAMMCKAKNNPNLGIDREQFIADLKEVCDNDFDAYLWRDYQFITQFEPAEGIVPDEECERIEDEEHVRLYHRYCDDEDDGTLYDDEDDFDDENEGKPEYVLATEDMTQIYPDYAKAVEGYNLHCAYYEREGWTTMCKKVAKNEVTIDGVKVRAMRAVYDKGDERREVELTVRIECD